MTQQHINIDEHEVAKFRELAPRWWDPDGECKPLHDINPLRLRFMQEITDLKGKRILDVGCGGGILSEGLARQGAEVTAIDASTETLAVAQLHLHESGLQVDYRHITVEELANQEPNRYDVVTCMEMLEHVPDPASVVAACAQLVKPAGHVFLSTLNRNPKAFMLAIVGAEYVLGMLPKGTHNYRQFIRPSELESWARDAGLNLKKLKGITYNPLFKSYSLGDDIDVNYLACCCP
jgi:2-polyprenyl-6-hydroxyphenyl methylase/3-demethylubiquinone-9 3-methyltransferase